MRNPKSTNPLVAKRHAAWRAQGALVRKAMVNAGLQQKDLAGAAGVPPSSMSEMIKGIRGIDPRQLKLLAERLGCGIELLIPDGGGGPPAVENLEPSDTFEPPGPAARGGRGDAEVEGFLERHAVTLGITRREAWYLRHNSHFRLEGWVTKDDKFWRAQLEFWRKYLREEDEAGGAILGGKNPL